MLILFAFNVNKAWYEHGKITLEKSCKYGLDNKVIVKEGELYASTLRYQSKIQRKFEGFKFFNSSKFLEKISCIRSKIMGIDINAKLIYGCKYSELPGEITEEVG